MKLLAIIFILSLPVIAKSKTGLQVMQMVDKANKGFVKETSEVKMVLRNAHGQEATREMKIKNFEISDKNNHALIEFSKPRDYKGTKLLTHQRHDNDNLQWLFLSRFKRVKQIHSGQQSGPFMGSEFSYED
ncbi:outer membrane lipoprotein-sorting protein, partial [Bacteriovoracaceae bacterium]|nr:outer membrane lipoprotein-sorting protein [Bacteriovoracaceae bacterium]